MRQTLPGAAPSGASPHMNEEVQVIDAYLKHEAERQQMGIPAKPLDPEQTAQLCRLLESPPAGKEQFLLGLLTERVAPGVDPAAEVKAGFLAAILDGSKSSPLISSRRTPCAMLGTMLGGYNVAPAGQGPAPTPTWPMTPPRRSPA